MDLEEAAGAPAPKAEQKRERLWELDVLRTAAIIQMVIFHAAFNLSYLSFENFPIRLSARDTPRLAGLLSKSTEFMYVFVIGIT